ncbi:MAG: hypothetical protein AAFN74_19690, partial [Myxococcota bacterium]
KRGHAEGAIDIGDAGTIVAPGEDLVFGPLIPIGKQGKLPRYLLTFDALGVAFIIDRHVINKSQVRALPFDVLATAKFDYEACIIIEENDTLKRLSTYDKSVPQASAPHYPFVGPTRILSEQYHLDPTASGCFGPNKLTAIRTKQQKWAVPEHDVTIETTNNEVLGAIMHQFGSLKAMPTIVVLSSDRKAIILHGPDGLQHRHTLPFEASEATMATAEPLLAIRSRSGEISVIHLGVFQTVAEVAP